MWRCIAERRLTATLVDIVDDRLASCLPNVHVLSAAEAAAQGGKPPRLVDIVDDRLAARVPNAAEDADNFVLGELSMQLLSQLDGISASDWRCACSTRQIMPTTSCCEFKKVLVKLHSPLAPVTSLR